MSAHYRHPHPFEPLLPQLRTDTLHETSRRIVEASLSLRRHLHPVRALVTYRAQTERGMRPEASLPLHYLFTSGPLSRGDFKQMTGLGERNAQALLSHLLRTGLVESDSKLGPVRFALPLDALQFYFPDLYPEAATRPEAE